MTKTGLSAGSWQDGSYVIPNDYSYLTLTFSVATTSGTILFTSTILCSDLYSVGTSTPLCVYSNGARDANTAIYVASGSGKQLVTFVGASVGSSYGLKVRKAL